MNISYLNEIHVLFGTELGLDKTGKILAVGADGETAFRGAVSFYECK